MTGLYLVRHGETDWNRANRCQGCIDIDLNEEGVKQAEAVAERLAGEPIDIVFSSQLSRAVNTAAKIAEKHSLEVIKSKALNEIAFGEWEGLTFEEMRARTDYNFSCWKTTPHLASFPGEGNLERVMQRSMDFITQIIKENEGKNIVVVSHGGILKTIILGLLDIPLAAYNRFYMTNASLSFLTIDGERSYINFLNDANHLRSRENTRPIF